MPLRNPVTADGLTVPDFEAFEAEHGHLDAQSWAEPNHLGVLRAHRDAWWSFYQSSLAGLGAGQAKASEARLLDRCDAQVVRFAELYNAAQSAARHRLHERTDMPQTTFANEPDMEALRSYLRTGNEGELRALGVATGSAGGYTVPKAFRDKIVETMKRFGGVRSVAEIITTSTGADMPFPTNDDTANVGAILGENTAVTEQDLMFGTKELRAYAYTSRMVRVSLQLLQDSNFDLDAYLARALARRVARAQNPHFTTGTGVSQPEGIQTNAIVGKTGAAGQVASVIYDDLVDLVHSVDPAYREEDEGSGERSSVVWMMNDLTLAKVRKLKDNDGQPLLEPDVKAGLPNTILGYRVVVNNDMPVMAASAKSILFGNLRAGYVIRDSLEFSVLRLVERYAEFLQHGVLGWQRSDALVQDSAAYRAYQNAAV